MLTAPTGLIIQPSRRNGSSPHQKLDLAHLLLISKVAANKLVKAKQYGMINKKLGLTCTPQRHAQPC